MSVQSEITRLENAKNSISTAITNKGVTVPSGTKLDGMAALIGNIESGGANLQTKSVTYTAYGTNSITPDDGDDGLSSVDVTVDVSGGGGGAKEPYIEETYDSNGKLIDVNLVGYTAIRAHAFYSCENLALTSLPSGITTIGNYAFRDCTSLALTSFPSGITRIGNNAFQKCTGLTSITFQGKPRTISSSAFSSCTNLKTINVPWASGEVKSAPWGATKAKINYNYTG